MTKDEILNLPAGRGMDMAVIRDVLKWKHVHTDDFAYVYINPKYGAVINFSPSTDIAAAWDVIESMRAGKFSFSVISAMHGILVEFVTLYGKLKRFRATAPTAPLAICRAALLTV